MLASNVSVGSSPQTQTYRMHAHRPMESTSYDLLHKLIGEQVVVGLELLLGLEQAGLDIEPFGVLEVVGREPQVARRDLADVIEGGRELALLERGKAFLE